MYFEYPGPKGRKFPLQYFLFLLENFCSFPLARIVLPMLNARVRLQGNTAFFLHNPRKIELYIFVRVPQLPLCSLAMFLLTCQLIYTLNLFGGTVVIGDENLSRA